MTLHDISRDEIGLRLPAYRRTFPLDQVESIVIHYSTGEEKGRPGANRWWSAIQQYHQNKGWADIGYAYGIHARQGAILEGRGIGVVAAHSPGVNASSVSLCVLGDDDPGQDVLDVARVRIVEFVADVFELLGREVPVEGHRDTQAPGYTACPGDELAGWIEAGMPLDKPKVKPKPKPAPKPKPKPKPEPEPDPVDWTEETIMALPTLKREDNGRHVRTVQGLLAARGHLPDDTDPVDGDFGPATERALKAFQKERTADDVDGVVGPRTWTALITGKDA